MAIIIPFGDPEAHGSIAHSVTFRRFRNKVVFQKKPRPKQPRTPAQQEQREKFKSGWPAYHSLQLWELEYLRRKAILEQRATANYFMSKWLTDEIPSKLPLTRLKEIIDITLNEPTALESQGLNQEFITIVDLPPFETLLASIWDNEKIFIPGAVSGDYDRATLQLSRPQSSVLHVPQDYPIVITWKDFSDIERENLIRLPALDISDTGVASTTPLSTVKELLNMIIDSPIAPDPQIIFFDFRSQFDTPVSQASLGDIWDNENSFLKKIIVSDQSRTFLKITNGFDPSHDPITNMKDMTDAHIIAPIGSNPASIEFIFIAGKPGAPAGVALGNTHDNENVFFDMDTVPLQTWGRFAIFNTLLPSLTIPEGYQIMLSWIDFNNDPQSYTFTFPETVLLLGIEKNIWIADDYTLYWDQALTDPCFPVPPPGPPITIPDDYKITVTWKDFNAVEHTADIFLPEIPLASLETINLWIANDFSLYYDQEMTQLAKTKALLPERLWIAKDFSLYWDKEMTMLASTPFW